MDSDGRIWIGGDQHWFPPPEFHKEAACGPTTCTNIFAYLSRVHPAFKALCTFDAANDIVDQTTFIKYMKEIYPFVKPGPIGLMPEEYIKGASDYAASKGISLQFSRLTIPAARSKRPSRDAVARFLHTALEANIPVAFLNLSSGRVKNLDSYHWVTLIAYDESSGICRIVDNGRALDVSLAQWLQRSAMGGAFVSCDLHANKIPAF